MSMTVQCLEVGPLVANCYVVGCSQTGLGFIVDPGGDGPLILDTIRRLGLTITHIFNTHCHPDHIGANCEVRDGLAATQVQAPVILVHEAEREAVERPPLQWLLIGLRPAPCRVDGVLTEGMELAIGQLQVRVLHLPGHSPGSVALVVGDAVFTGDTLFAGGIGRTDLPGGNQQQIMRSLKRLISELAANSVVYPGHGPPSTLGEEARSNPWLASLR